MKNLDKRLLRISLLISLFWLAVLLPHQEAKASVPIAEIIRQGVKKIIVAVDLKIQRMQNETIWLQQAQQKLENVLTESQLAGIASWSQKQRDLYGDYYESLWKVKSMITQFQKVKAISASQAELLRAYQKSWNLIVEGGVFSPQEILLIERRYGEILRQSAQNIQELTQVLRSYALQVSDGERLEQIMDLEQRMHGNFRTLTQLNLQLESLSSQRSYWLKEGKTLENLFK
ncbi:conjugal transfer protein TraI [Algoriphagus formosus]|uniref:Conjugal transfer protein TraI n=1 Tax=Algoriphagus formosus TaxID=2007308 RepID=A0A4R5VEN9_9BACT|nr:conjugal transfer protein TraI [Algoriphagus aquimaris]TDK50844.1 conjugal transfer protein TraI [Algoriphagus aquimaris]